VTTPAFNPNLDYQATAPAFDPDAVYTKDAPAKKKKAEPGFLDREISLSGPAEDQAVPGSAGLLRQGATLSGLQSVGRGVRDAVKGTWQTLAAPPQDDTETAIGAIGPAALPLYRMLRSLGHTAEDATQVVGAIHDINDSPDPAGTYLKAGQEFAGQGAGQALVAAATEGAARVLPNAGELVPSTSKATAPVRAVVKATNKVLAKAPGSVGAAAGAAVGHYIPIPGASEIGAAAGYALGKEVLPQVRIPGEGIGLPSRVRGGPAVAPQYAAPAAEVVDDLEGIPSPQTEAAGHISEAEPPAEPAEPVEDLEGVPSAQTAAAGELSEAEPPAFNPHQEYQAAPVEAPKPASKFTTPTGRIKPAVGKQLQNELERGLGNNAPVATKPIAQVPIAQAPAELPEGFTATKSSALRGYKYDPAAREFEYITNDGSHYIRGDVAPEAAEQFEKTAVEKDSFGKAWHELRQNPQGGVGVAKVINGKRVAIVKTAPITDLQQQIKDSVPPSQAPTGAPITDLSKQIKQSAKRTVVVDASGKPEFSDVLEAKQAKPAPAKAEPAAPAAGEDLTAQLQASIEHVGKGGVFTSASPKSLLDRWGVDPESFTEGRSQTRGMSPQDSEAAIAKLTEAYKKGQAVEPVLETRDAQNNIIEVDGRGRALAAHRAGVERIPVVVRRMNAEAPAEMSVTRVRKGTNATKANAENSSAAIPGPRKPSAPTAPGAQTTIRVPGEDRTYNANYQVRELSDVQPSHSGITFNPNEKYALVNDRDYSNPLNQGKVVTNSGPGKFDPSYHITDNPDATNGPVVVDSDGHALGGNGRAMILQRVYKYNPEGTAAYRAMLEKKAAQFGLDPQQISKMKQPVLVRELADSELEGNGKQEAITDFNKSGTAAMTPAERAIADSRRISANTLDDIAHRLEQTGPDATLADLLRGRNGTQVLDKLIDDGVLPHQERAGLASGDALTEAGNDRIRKMIVGRFFRDPAQIDTTPAGLRSKLESMAAPLSRVDGVVGWDLTPHIQDAMSLLEEARTHGIVNLDDLLAQRGFWGDARYSPEAVTLAKAMQGSSARTLLAAARKYLADMSDAHRPLFAGDKISADQAFREAFENPQPVKGKNAANPKQINSESLF
jgi:hypothetical protein